MLRKLENEFTKSKLFHTMILDINMDAFEFLS